MKNHDPVVLDEQNYNSGIDELEHVALSEIIDEIVIEQTIVVEAIVKSFEAHGAAESLAIAFTDDNQAARDAGIQLFLRTVGTNIKRDVEAEAKRRFDDLMYQADQSAAQDKAEAMAEDL